MTYVLPIVHNCDPKLGGRPLCKLPLLKDSRGRPFVTTAHVKGASAYEVVQKARDLDFEDREYNIFFIGEAPGWNEDQTGMPFVGEAGDIFSYFITTAGFDLFKGYVTNVTKCRPPKNRDPSVLETNACLLHIQHELKKFRPKVIMLLGRVPLRLFNLHNEGGIGRLHGELFERTLPGWDDGPVFKIIPTYHPAAFLHKDSPQLKRRVLDDYVFAKKVLDSDITPTAKYHEAPYTLCDTVDKVRSMVGQIKEAKIFSFDTESPNLDFMRAPMITAQFSIGKGFSWVVPFYRHDPEGADWKLRTQWSMGERATVIGLLSEIFCDPEIAKAAHNIKYDWRVILRWLGLRMNGPLWCTQALHHLLDEYSPHDLEYLADIEFGVGHYGSPVKEIVGKGRDLIATYDNIPDPILHQYGATDAECTHRLLMKYLPQVIAKPHLLHLYQTQILPSIYTLAKAEWAGNKMNMDVVKKLGKRFDKELEELTSKCRALSKPDFNPGSPPQVTELFKSMGLGHLIEASEKATGYTTNKDTLQPLGDKYPIAKHVLDYRNRKKMRSTYIDNVFEDLGDDGRLRYSFNISGTVTGRLACRFLHQIPNINEEEMKKKVLQMRQMFSVDPGNLFFYGDFSQIEFRIWAILAGEEKLIELFKDPKTDMHTITAAAALGIDITQVSAYNRVMVGKPTNFAIVYGSSGKEASKGDYEDPKNPGKYIHLNFPTMQRFIKNFKEEYKQIDYYLETVPERARANGCVLRSIFGRERRIHGLNSPDRKLRAEAERQAVNFTIQNPAAEITYRTMNKMDEVIDKHALGTLASRKAMLLNTVHDSLSYEVAEYLIEWFEKAFRQVATAPVPELGGASFPVKCGHSSQSWAHAELAAC
jgi:DNA polymerase-1